MSSAVRSTSFSKTSRAVKRRNTSELTRISKTSKFFEAADQPTMPGSSLSYLTKTKTMLPFVEDKKSDQTTEPITRSSQKRNRIQELTPPPPLRSRTTARDVYGAQGQFYGPVFVNSPGSSFSPDVAQQQPVESKSSGSLEFRPYTLKAWSITREKTRYLLGEAQRTGQKAVFISYRKSKENDDYVAQICANLEKAGVLIIGDKNSPELVDEEGYFTEFITHLCVVTISVGETPLYESQSLSFNI